MDYLDFDLEISADVGREYVVKVVRSPIGEIASRMRFPFDDLDLKSHLKSLQIALLRSGSPHDVRRKAVLTHEEEELQGFGGKLFDALMAGPVRTLYYRSRDKARSEGKGLRIRLRFEAPELARLPWEFLHEPDRGYLALANDTPIVRYLQLRAPIDRLAVAPPLRILGLIANAEGLAKLDERRERQRMEEALHNLVERGAVEMVWLEGRTWRDLLRAMRKGPWHIFHFVGHGGFESILGEGHIVLADEQGKPDFLRASKLAQLLADHFPLRLVLLNSCEGAESAADDIFSSTAATLVSVGIPAVIAMQYEIGDLAAIEFARTFYEALADGLPVDAAVSEARKAIMIAFDNSVEWGTPALFMRSLDGQLFDLAAAPRPIRPQQEPAAVQPPQEAAPTARTPDGPSTAVSAEGVPSPAPSDQLASLYTEALGYYYTDRWAQAIELFRRIADQQPGFRDTANKLEQAERRAESARLWAEAERAFAAGEWAAAVEGCEAVLKAEPGHGQAPARLAEARQKLAGLLLYEEAQRLCAARDWAAALRALDDLAARDPCHADPDGLRERATSAAAAEERERKLAGLYESALLAMDANHWVAALGHLQELMALQDDYRNALELLARVQEHLAPSAPPAAEATPEPAKKPAPRKRATTAPKTEAQERAAVPAALPWPIITVENAARLESWTTSNPHAGSPIFALAFSPDGSLLATAARNGSLSLLPVGKGGLAQGRYLTEHKRGLRTVAFSPDGSLVASAGDDRVILLSQISDRKVLRKLEEHQAEVRSLAFSPDGKVLASAGGSEWVGSDGKVRLWDVATGKCTATLMDKTEKTIYGVRFSPDGTQLAASYNDGVLVWSLPKQEVRYRLKNGASWMTNIYGLAFAPDGWALLGASSSNHVHVWDLRSGKLTGRLEGHSSTVYAVAVSPDGRLAASAADGGSIRVWNLEKASSLYSASTEGTASDIAFSPDGRLLAVACHGGKVRLYRVQS